MSEEQKTQEKTQENAKALAQGAVQSAAVKVSDLIGKKEVFQHPGDVEERIQAQIQNNQELYTTLSRSLLELHNDMREFRHKLQTTERMIFSLQQGTNKLGADVNARLNALEEAVQKLTDLWNTCVKEAEAELDATDGEGKENTEVDEENLRGEEG